MGVWSADTQKESSNYRELRNLVEFAEEEARSGRLDQCEFFLFTDNQVAESVYYRGSSASPLLHELVLRLKKLEMTYQMVLHVIHVAGERMVAQGTDGCSRGDLMEGVMSGKDMLSYLDLGKTAISRHPPLLDWVRSWTRAPNLEPLTPEGWFEEGHGISGGFWDRSGVRIPTHTQG